MSSLTSILVYTFIGTFVFYIGFILGSLVDAAIYKIYTKIDPLENSITYIILFLTLQIFILSFFQVLTHRMDVFKRYQVFHRLFEIGYVLSQLFIAAFAIKQMAFLTYSRNESVPVFSYLFDRKKEEKRDPQ